jgi:glucose-6-phosphate-specific signal transduction histidine kinase
MGGNSGHYGLTSMRDRITRLGGTFAVHSRLHEGTTIAVRLPLPDSDGELADGVVAMTRRASVKEGELP